MTIGIYVLYWEDDLDKVYIGKSTNIENRVKEHLKDLKNESHYNKKMQETFKIKGPPTYQVLEESTTANLDTLEIIYIEEFQAYKLGYNLTKGGESGSGYSAPNSKVSKRQVLKIFSLLYRTDLVHRKIAEKFNVKVGIVNTIACGNTHKWLKEEYPTEYSRMYSKVNTGRSPKDLSDLKVFKSMSKYSRIKILKVFSLLYKKYSLDYISKYTKVPKQVIINIKYGTSHKWLQRKFPEQYKLLKN